MLFSHPQHLTISPLLKWIIQERRTDTVKSNVLNSTYSTSDLYLSAYLKSKGLPLIDTQKTGNKVVFIFDDQTNRKELIREFFNDGKVSITAFKNAIQDLKTMVFNI